MFKRFTELNQERERQHLENLRDLVFKNTFADIEKILRIGKDNDTRFEFECHDISHLYNLAYFVDRGLVKTSLFIQAVCGFPRGIAGHPEDLMHIKRTADRLFCNDYQWSIPGAGRNQITLASQDLAQGTNVRVGLEDSLWIVPGQLAQSNADQVTKIRQVIEGLSFEVATLDEACAMLQLKGADQVAF